MSDDYKSSDVGVGWSPTNTRGVPKSASVSDQVKVTVANDERGQYYITEQSVPRHNALEDHYTRLDAERNAVSKHERDNDPVNSPSHYTSGGIETVDFIEAKGLNYNLGNVVKYITRQGKKFSASENPAQDLEKAVWYLQREIQNIKKA